MLGKLFRFHLIIICLLLSGREMAGQNPYGTTGLLRMPTAEMQTEGTFMIGNTFLPKRGTEPHRETYNTFNYFFNITIFSWMEVAYTLTMNQGRPGGYWPEETWGRFVNQDRSFHVKFRVFEEGRWNEWVPQISIGANDPLTHGSFGGGDLTLDGSVGSNNYLTRFFIAASKHLDFGDYGYAGVHAAWIIGHAKDELSHYSRPALGLQYYFAMHDGGVLDSVVNGLSVMFEYDARSVNIGLWYDFPEVKRRLSGESMISFHSYVELNQCKYPTAGVLFKLHLL